MQKEHPTVRPLPVYVYVSSSTLAETLMTSFRVGVARDVRPLELLWLARARRVNGFCTSITIELQYFKWA